MSTAQNVYFLLLTIFALFGAVGTVVAKSPLRAAMALLATIVSLAGMYLGLNAELLAAIQLLVYAGAIVVLFIFVIMLIGPSAVVPHDSRGILIRTFGLLSMALLTAGLAFSLGVYQGPEIPILYPVCPPGEVCRPFGGVEAFGNELYRNGLLPFELVSITLLVAIVGAIAVARGRTVAEIEAQKKAVMAQEAERARQASEQGAKLPAEATAAEGGSA